MASKLTCFRRAKGVCPSPPCARVHASIRKYKVVAIVFPSLPSLLLENVGQVRNVSGAARSDRPLVERRRRSSLDDDILIPLSPLFEMLHKAAPHRHELIEALVALDARSDRLVHRIVLHVTTGDGRQDAIGGHRGLLNRPREPELGQLEGRGVPLGHAQLGWRWGLAHIVNEGRENRGLLIAPVYWGGRRRWEGSCLLSQRQACKQAKNSGPEAHV